MIELKSNELIFRFPEVHEDAVCNIEFQRTLRIPDDGSEYPLPAGMGPFPLSHIEDYSETAPKSWIKRGGVLMPMYQSEALWIRFFGDYPMAIKIAAGKINAVSGKTWTDALNDQPQDYLVSDAQPWLDGFCVKKGYIRQFVAMPLGDGYSAEEQITGEAEFGGLQVIAFPIKAEYYEKMLKERQCYEDVMFCRCAESSISEPAMGMAPGGLMRQDIYDDEYGIDAWDTRYASRCFVHLVNSEAYELITGHNPPLPPISKNDYKRFGMPWFDYYAENKSSVTGSGVLNKLKSISSFAKSNNKKIWDNGSINVGEVKVISAESHSTTNVVSEKDF